MMKIPVEGFTITPSARLTVVSYVEKKKERERDMSAGEIFIGCTRLIGPLFRAL